MRTPEIQGASIVMIGSFNPAIFQPRWLGSQQLIRPEEAEKAKVMIVQSDVADVSTEWFQLQVLQNRFSLATTDPRHFSPLRDLGAGLFVILPHTPVAALGMNRQFHFKTPSLGAWHAIGHLLAPKDPWKPVMDGPGLRSMLMEGRRKEANGGTLHIKVEPSSKVQNGLYVEVNEEFKAPPDRDADGAQWVPDRLAEHWDAIMKFSETAAEHLLGLVKA
jgi:hypothetical protein